MEWVNNSANRWINKRGQTVWWLSRKGAEREWVFSWAVTWQREGSFLSLWTCSRLYNPEPWHWYRHLLLASLCQSTVYTQTSASLHKKRGHTALDRSALRWPCLPVLYTKTLMHPVKSLAGDTISLQAPIKPSVSTCDKDDHLFS